MLGDSDAGACDHECGCRRNIERALLIAAGATGIEHSLAGDIDPVRLFAHNPRRTGDLVDGFTLHAQRGQKGRHLERRRLAGHDLVHDSDGFKFRQVNPVDNLVDCFAYVHGNRAPGSLGGGECFGIIFFALERAYDSIGFLTRAVFADADPIPGLAAQLNFTNIGVVAFIF